MLWEGSIVATGRNTLVLWAQTSSRGNNSNQVPPGGARDSETRVRERDNEELWKFSGQLGVDKHKGGKQRLKH